MKLTQDGRSSHRKSAGHKYGERWRTLAAATDVIQTAIEDWDQNPTVERRTAVDLATRAYVECLALFIGQIAALKYHASLQHYHDAMHRVNVTLPATERHDFRENLFEQLRAEEAAAAVAYETVAAETLAALTKAIDMEDEESGLDRA